MLLSGFPASLLLRDIRAKPCVKGAGKRRCVPSSKNTACWSVCSLFDTRQTDAATVCDEDEQTRGRRHFTASHSAGDKKHETKMKRRHKQSTTPVIVCSNKIWLWFQGTEDQNRKKKKIKNQTKNPQISDSTKKNQKSKTRIR